MRRIEIRFMKKILVYLSFSLLLTACSTSPNPASAHLMQQIEKPFWFIFTGSEPLNNVSDVSKLWQQQGSEKVFYKSCYKAIDTHPDDDQLVVKCLYLMSAGIQSDKHRQIKLRRLLADTYPMHNDDLSRCANCMVGDTVARNAQRLAYSERYQTSVGESVLVLERVLDQRQGDISLWVQAEIYQDLMRYYGEVNFTPERRQRIKTAFAYLSEQRLGNQPLADRFAKLEKAYRELVKN